jgi:hypothetical protein
MGWFDLDEGAEPAGFLALPESMTGPDLLLELHVSVDERDRTVAYWLLDDDVFVAEVEVGRA